MASQNDEENVSVCSDALNNEEWRIVNYANGKISLTRAINYNNQPNLLKYVKKGDIIFEATSGSSAGNLVGHVALVVDIYYDETFDQEYVLLIEAVDSDGSNGVIFSALTPTRFNDAITRVIRIPSATEEQLDGAISFCIAQYGKGYNLHFGMPNTSIDTGMWYCSELLYAAFYNQGINFPVAHIDEINFVSYPVDFICSSLTKKIMGKELDTSVINNISDHTIQCDNDTLTENHNYIEYNECYEICRICEHINNTKEHVYNFNYISNDKSYHRSYCICGEYIVQSHELIEDEGVLKCICGFEPIVHLHSPVEYESLNDGIKHYKICACGYKELEYCIGLNTGLGFSICTKCNQQINSTSGPILTKFAYKKENELEIEQEE